MEAPPPPPLCYFSATITRREHKSFNFYSRRALCAKTMIFIWTSNGGPLQYIGVALFAAQFLPHFLPGLSADINAISVPALMGTASVLSASLLLTAIYSCRSGAIDRAMRWRWDAVRETIDASDTDLALLLSGAAMLFSALAIVWGGCGYAVGLLAQIAAAICVIRHHIGEAAAAGVDGLGGHTGVEVGQQRRMSEILRTVQGMPVEEFVPKEDVNDGAKVSISKLKRMLKARRWPVEEGGPGALLERRDLVEALLKCRNYCETCCICCEEYEEGSPLRVLPNCRHEFHLECLDQWAYTFASGAKRQREPSCPLCNVSLG